VVKKRLAQTAQGGIGEPIMLTLGIGIDSWFGPELARLGRRIRALLAMESHIAEEVELSEADTGRVEKSG
jgi:hypothetical protein